MGIRELRDTLTKTIRRVRAGETIEVTHDGRAVALIVPVRADLLDRLAAEGKVRPPLERLVLPEPLEQTGAISASEALQDDRGD
jgi:prevent-host-death family protein